VATQTLLLYLLIVGCEVAFWVVLLVSLAVRYVLQQEALSRWLLRSLPLIDLLLLFFTAIDLKAGTTATFAHGLAAAYVGFTLLLGSAAIRWADAHFAYRFAGGPVPAKAPSGGWGLFRFDFALWLRSILAWIIALALIEALIAYAGNDTATQPLLAWHKYAFGSVVLWFIFGPFWSLFLVRRGAR
jgi:hypothetical protein